MKMKSTAPFLRHKKINEEKEEKKTGRKR